MLVLYVWVYIVTDVSVVCKGLYSTQYINYQSYTLSSLGKKMLHVEGYQLAHYCLFYSAVSEWLEVPSTQFMLDQVRPDFLLLRVGEEETLNSSYFVGHQFN